MTAPAPNPQDAILIPETVTAALGFDAILKGDAHLSAEVRDRAVSLPKTIRRDILTWLSSDSVSKAGHVHPVTWKEANRLLFESKAEETAQALMDALDTPVAISLEYAADLPSAVSALVTKIVHYLSDQFPRRVKPDLLAAKSVPTDAVDWMRFRRLWEVACDPAVLIEDLRSNTLVTPQVKAVELMFPQIYAAMNQAMIDALISLKGQRKSWKPSPRQVRLIQMLLQLTQGGGLDLSAAVSQAEAQQQKAPAPKRSAAKLSLPGAQTPGQAAESTT